MLRKTTAILGVGAAAMGLVATVSSALAETTLTAASCFPIGSPPSRPFEAIVKSFNQEGEGIVKIDLKGGAPAIGSPFTLTQKTSRGAYDMVGCTEAYFGNVIPEAPVLRLSNLTHEELRKNGGMDYVKNLLAEKGLHYLARHHDFGRFHLWLSKPITKPDLTGMHLRVSPVYTAFFKSLGATVQRSNIAQIYTYMENGTVQGFGWPAQGWVPSWIKVTKYRVDPGFYSAALHTLINLRTWKKLSNPEKALLTKVGMRYEADSETTSAKFQAARAKQMKWYADNGMKTINFTGADGKKWVDAAYAAGWQEVLDRSPKHGPALRKLFVK